MRDLIYRDEALNEVAIGKDKNEIQGGILNLPSVETKELIAQINIDTDELVERVKKIAWNELFTEELEKIKSEIIDYYNRNGLMSTNEVIHLLEAHIKELNNDK